jgi:hypothetical protein
MTIGESKNDEIHDRTSQDQIFNQSGSWILCTFQSDRMKQTALNYY